MTTSDTFIRVPGTPARSAQERTRLLAEPGFGKLFSDHMATMNWSEGSGWHDARIRLREPFSIDPASAVLHYAQEIFEGVKAYKREDKTIVLFRPEENARRFNASARRMAMPELPESIFVEAIEQLIKADEAWMPEGDGSLYIRPFMFANDVFLGVKPASHYIFCVIASPVGPYFKGGARPLAVWVSDQYSRAASGGTGAAKCGGNYAGGLIAQKEALAHDCDQVVFLDAAEHRWIEELGGMNIFFVMDDGEIRTPPLGTILPGITRASLIDLARADGLRVNEARYSFEDWRADAISGKLREVFVCGTAATVVSVGEIRFNIGSFRIDDGLAGPVTDQLRRRLLDIQQGRAADPFGWCRTVTEPAASA
ncbi:branched-chain amino acid aminotransferase [Burkholderia lata]|uniref:Branched-chain-amino-acid aminotransferase n=1 Tax=Burkholderia lata (strain ATCC 17760 / DSM 23089 / LMG 22485 / NCIMB 9086 / R18194 / 383) TaxID=482957 RepID=A0A6P2SKF2_BURL3|nr:branched-chain amino acid aminotransferase [Burkholderia lata]VWC51095.1 branched-chain amino acid aminotransferase [Burkholderia lata]